MRAAGQVLVSAHQPTWLPTLHVHQTSPDLVETLVAELLDPERARALRPRTDALFRSCGGNVRAILGALYDDCATSQLPSLS